MSSGWTRRHVVLGLLVALGLGGGIGYGAVASPPAPVAPLRLPAPSASLVEKTSYCPPAAFSGSAESLVLDSAGERDALVSMPGGRIRLAPGRAQQRRLPASAAAGFGVRGLGAPVVAALSRRYHDPVEGADAALCSPVTAARWYVPAGTSRLHTAEELLIYNPFPNDAAVRVTFYTPEGARTSANLADIGVAGGKGRVVPVDRYARPSDVLAAAVEAVRGRIAVWSAVAYEDRAHQVPGVATSPGVPIGDGPWYLPEALVSGGHTTVSLLNPTERTATVTLTIATASGPAQIPGLNSVSVPPRSVKAVDLSKAAARAARRGSTVGVTVRSADGVPIAVGGITTAAGGVRGISSAQALVTPARRWSLPPPWGGGAHDRVWVLNPTGARVTVSATLQRAGGKPSHPRGLQRVRIPPGGRAGLEIPSEGPVTVLLRASAQVIAARSVHPDGVGDRVALGGVPLPPP